MRSPSGVIHLFQRPAYLILGLAIAQQAMDFALTIRPLQPALAAWRFQMLVVATSTLGGFVLLYFLLQLVAYLCADRRMLAILAPASALVALLLFLCAASFGLDAMQVRRQINPQLLGKFDLAAMQAGCKFLAGAVACAYGALHAWRAAEALRPGRESTTASTDAGRVQPMPAL